MLGFLSFFTSSSGQSVQVYRLQMFNGNTKLRRIVWFFLDFYDKKRLFQVFSTPKNPKTPLKRC